ncbi:MAG: type VI secretion system tip protein TssI/VgrG [Polyangiaceae bacterium]
MSFTPRSVKLESEEFACADLDVVRVDGVEEISELYRFEVTLRPHEADHHVLDVEEIVGAEATLRFTDDHGITVRAVHAVVAGARALVDGSVTKGMSRTPVVYRVVLRPRAHVIDLVATQEVFLNLSVPEIIALKFERMDPSYAVFRVRETYPKREFVVQYRETDLAFVRRLAEHVGLAFHFENVEGVDGTEQERIVFSDRPDAMPQRFAEPLAFGPREEHPAVHELEIAARAVPHFFAVQDYDYRHPRLDLGATAEVPEGMGGVVEYGTHHKSPEEGQHLANVRAEAAQAARRRLAGKGVVGWLSAGTRFKLEHSPFPGPAELVVARVEHRMEQPQAIAGAPARDASGYDNSFEAVSADRAYRPPRVTPRPRIHGFLTAVVQADPGSSSSEPALDDEGRYHVQFHFDTADREGHRASRPIRLALPFAGPNQGMHFPLTPETEVLVAFTDGDPDRPVIIGAVQNAVTPIRVSAADAHMHRIRSRHGLIVEFGKTRRN